MKEIKAILFDFGGTLDSRGADWFARMYGYIGRRGPGLPAEQFFAAACWAANHIGTLPDTPHLSMEGTVVRLCRHIHEQIHLNNGQSGPRWQPEEIAQEFVEESIAMLRENIPVLRELRGQYRLGCISNNWGNALGWCRQFQLDEIFETVIDSTLVGAVKPDRRIFAAALEQMKLRPAECAYVGDRYDCDMVGSFQAGMMPVWITDGSWTGELHPAVKPRQITHLKDLLE